MNNLRTFDLGPSWCFISAATGLDRYGWGVIYGRFFGYGLHLSGKKREDALFSERYGYRKAYYLLGVRLEFLTPK